MIDNSGSTSSTGRSSIIVYGTTITITAPTISPSAAMPAITTVLYLSTVDAVRRALAISSSKPLEYA